MEVGAGIVDEPAGFVTQEFPPQPFISDQQNEKYKPYVDVIMNAGNLDETFRNYIVEKIIENAGNQNLVLNSIAIDKETHEQTIKGNVVGLGLGTDEEIKEYEDEYIYIPCGGSCFYSCIEKIYGKKKITFKKPVSKYNDGRILKKLELWNKVNILKFERDYWVKRNKKWPSIENVKYSMALFEFYVIGDKKRKKYGHYILFKDKKIRPNWKYIAKNIKIIPRNITFGNFNKYKQLNQPYPKRWEDKIIISDIEASPEETNKDYPLLHREYMLGYKLVNFNKPYEPGKGVIIISEVVI